MWAWPSEGAGGRVLTRVDGPGLQPEAVERVLPPSDLESHALGVIRPIL